MSKPTIAVYGGTFDPVHAGHLAVARLARDRVNADLVLFLPCLISPHKTQGPDPASGDDRLAMLEAAIRGLDWVRIDDRELRRAGVSYSWQTAAELRQEHPEADLFWILGADQWNALPGWRFPERIAELAEFLVISRDGEQALPRKGFRAQFLEGGHPASSSHIRKVIAEGGHLPAGWVLPEVEQWIKSHRLYESVPREAVVDPIQR